MTADPADDVERYVTEERLHAATIERERHMMPRDGMKAALLRILPSIIAQARAEERERAAQVAEARHEFWNRAPHEHAVCDDITACSDIAAAIRALPKDSANG